MKRSKMCVNWSLIFIKYLYYFLLLFIIDWVTELALEAYYSLDDVNIKSYQNKKD